MRSLSLGDISASTVAVAAGAAVIGAAAGYVYARKQRDMLQFKSWNKPGPLLKYVHEKSLRLNPGQENLLKATVTHEKAGMLSDPIQMQMLQLICKTLGAKKTLDIGVFTGYSAVSIALALPDDGKVIACDITDEYPKIGMPYWKEAGVDNKIDLRVAPAVETLNNLIDSGESGTFDFAYIDADKGNYLTYVELCTKLLRKGGIIALDNTLWSGQVVNAFDTSPCTQALRAVNDALHADTRFDLSLVTVGDGTTICRLR